MAGQARPVGVFRSNNKGCLYVLGATIGLAIVAQVLLELHVVPLTPRIRRHFLPLFQSKSYSERFDGELGPDEKISIGLIVPFTVSVGLGFVFPPRARTMPLTSCGACRPKGRRCSQKRLTLTLTPPTSWLC